MLRKAINIRYYYLKRQALSFSVLQMMNRGSQKFYDYFPWLCNEKSKAGISDSRF